MNVDKLIKSKLSFLGSSLLNDIVASSSILKFEKDTELLREGQFVKVIPIVIKGLIKVLSRYEDKELLLYYIKPSESCVMSFSASLKNTPSQVFAITEEQTTVILLPVNKIGDWAKNFPNFNQLFFEQYNVRYNELLKTINHLLFDKLDVRLYNYLVEKKILLKKIQLKFHIGKLQTNWVLLVKLLADLLKNWKVKTK